MIEDANKELLPQLVSRWQEAAPEVDGLPLSLASVAVTLRAVGLMHQAAHWQTKGLTFYSDHKLFQKIYGAVGEEIDAVSEKAIALGDSILVCPIKSSELALELLEAFGRACDVPDADKLVKLSLEAERGLLQVIKTALQDDVTDGVENLLQGISDKHEGHVYLLQQRLKQR
jgi:DNA-binding ferritin-like protein